MIGGHPDTDSGRSHPGKEGTKAPKLSNVLTVNRFHKMTSVRVSSVFKNTVKSCNKTASLRAVKADEVEAAEPKQDFLVILCPKE
jgi:hypothetical protein